MKFNINSPLFQFITTLSEFVLLNIIFLISCLPIVTIGASITALYYVTMQEARAEHGYIIRSYIRSWKQNFVQSTIIWLLLFLVGNVLFFNLIFWYNLQSLVGNVIFALLFVLAILYATCFLYVYPLLSRFKNTTKHTLHNSLFIPMHNPKMTLLLLLMNGVFMFLAIIIPQAKIFMLLLGFAFFAYCNSFLFTKIFKKYETTEENLVYKNIPCESK